MIKPNVILALLAVCGLLAAAFFLMPSDRMEPSEKVQEGTPLVGDFKPEAVNAIHIKKAGTEIRLVKKDGNWSLPSHQNRPAKSDRVQALLENVKEAKLQSQRTGSESTFGLDEKGRIELTLEGEGKKTELFLGRSQESNKSFVRTSASGPIIEVNKPLDTDASARTLGTDRIIDAQHFYDLRIVNLSQDDITEFTIARKTAAGDEKLRLQKLPATKKPEEEAKAPQPVDPDNPEKKEEPKFEWWIIEPAKAEADEGAVNSIVSNLSNMNAKAYADNVKPEESGIDKPNAVVTLKAKDGKETTITFGKQEGEEVILQVSGNTNTYKAYKFVLENVQKDLKKKEEEKNDAAITPLVPPAEKPKAPEPVIQQPPAKKEATPIPAIPGKTEDKPDAKAPPAVPK